MAEVARVEQVPSRKGTRCNIKQSKYGCFTCKCDPYVRIGLFLNATDVLLERAASNVTSIGLSAAVAKALEGSVKGIPTGTRPTRRSLNLP
jgi:hypothetical protein